MRRLLQGLVTFAAIMAVGLVAWPAVAPGFCSGFQQAGNALIGPLRFGKFGRAEFATVQRSQTGGVEDAVSWNARVGLRMDGVDESVPILLNPRRLAYLPLLVFVAAVAAAPLRARRKLVCLLCGIPLLLAMALASVWIVIA